MKPYPTYERVRELLDYSPQTGLLIWRPRPVGTPCWSVRRVGKVAGQRRRDGYIVLQIDGVRWYYAHVLIWIWATGEPHQIDHKDGNPSNNRWTNLRRATQALNVRNAKKSRNNTSGFKGVRRSRRGNAWQASIVIDGRQIYLGQRPTPHEAHQLYCAASLRYHSEFGRTE